MVVPVSRNRRGARLPFSGTDIPILVPLNWFTGRQSAGVGGSLLRKDAWFITLAGDGAHGLL